MKEMNLEAFGTETAKPVNYKNKVSTPASSPSINEEEKDILNSISLVQWAVCGPHTYKPVASTTSKLQSGVYSISVSQYHGVIYQKKSVCIDDLLRFPDSISDRILGEITTFWGKGEVFSKYGFLHRRGYLLHGPAGSGKTSLVQQIISDIVKSDGLVFQCTNHPAVFIDGLAQFRKVEPNRPIVCLFEDLDAIISEHGEDEILQLLDGESAVDKCLNIATSNYPEKLDKRLVARPRRFDRVILIPMPSKEVRRLFFERKLKITGEELEMWANKTDGLSFAACAELVISVKCFDNSFENSLAILKEMMAANISSRDYTGGIGFK